MELKRSIRARAARLVAMFAMALVCALVLVPSAYADGAVACIGEKEYNTFDEAVAAAKNGETVTLLADAETAGLNLDKDLTIDGNSHGNNHALKFADKGIALWGHALVLKNVNASMTDIGSTPYTAEWNWMAVGASGGASITLDNASLAMDGAKTASGTHAIYFTGDNKLNLKNGSNLSIKNYPQDALEWDGGSGYNVNIEGNSTYTSDHCRSGFTGTFHATIDHSTVNVVNSTGNGSNGSHFNIKNGSTVDFSGNGSHGLSAGNLTIDNSTVTAKDNALTGIIFTGKGEFKSANVQISGTKGTSYWNAGMRLLKANASLDVDAASTVSITGNKVTGLYLDGGSHATFAEGAKLAITGNDASQENCSTEKHAARMGGGVMVRSNASLSLPASAKIDNNHAALAGDDLCAEQGATISFGKTVEGDTLTDFNGCGDAITGWFDDSEDARWCTHWTDNTPWHVKAVEADSYKTPITLETTIALKAAHGVTAAHAEISGTKVLKGAELAEGDFEFTLSQNDDVISHAKNAADGSFTFGESAFDVTADDIMHTDNHKVSYTLDVAEVKGNKVNVTYDTSVKKVVVTAVPEDDHVKLTYSVDGKDVEDLASALVFTNTYTKPAEPSEPKTPGTSTKQNLPKTGDASLATPVAFILTAAVACGAGVVMRRRG